MTERLAHEHGKEVSLITLGLEDIPESWVSTLFDLLGQLLRNAIEHGIETPAERLAKAKSAQGTLVVEFIARVDSFELLMQDDGRGLDAGGIAHSAVKKGLLSTQAAQLLDHARLVSLIFQPGVTTAADATRRGQGMKIVRQHVQRLGGRIQASTKTDLYTRFRVQLPALALDDPQLSLGA
jgi:two-component system chemotaxis sensor kinase CheA